MCKTRYGFGFAENVQNKLIIHAILTRVKSIKLFYPCAMLSVMKFTFLCVTTFDSTIKTTLETTKHNINIHHLFENNCTINTIGNHSYPITNSECYRTRYLRNKTITKNTTSRYTAIRSGTLHKYQSENKYFIVTLEM